MRKDRLKAIGLFERIIIIFTNASVIEEHSQGKALPSQILLNKIIHCLVK
jgi:hypothetical protein